MSVRGMRQTDVFDAGRLVVAFVQERGRGWRIRTDQPHLVEGIDQVLRRFGGTARVWRVDRMATVINPTTGKLQTSFAPVAKHYGVDGGAVPTEAGEPQRCRGETDPLPDPTLVADRRCVVSLAEAQASRWIGSVPRSATPDVAARSRSANSGATNRC